MGKSTLFRAKAQKSADPQLGLDLGGGRALDPAKLRRPEVLEHRTRFPKGVKHHSEFKRLLVSGYENSKIGRTVQKGEFSGYDIYTLSFEERATCPESCLHYATCYGNNMPYAKRISTEDLYGVLRRLRVEVYELTRERGALVRLHALGDFPTVWYVSFWGDMLRTFPSLAIYGYTAWDPHSAIGLQVARIRKEFGSRFSIRWSNGGMPTDCTVPTLDGSDVGDAIICPEQTGKTRACATCALCWATPRNIAFLEH